MMNIKVYGFIPIIIFVTINSFGQGEVNILDQTINPGMVIEEFDFRPKEVVAYCYFNNEWFMGGINLKNGQKVRDHYLKFDIYSNHLEVRVNSGIRICPYQKIDQFFLISVIKNDTLWFSDGKNYSFPDRTPLVGFLQILLEGEYSLAVHHNAKKQQSTYVQALDMGDRREKIVSSETYFIVREKDVLCKLGNHTKSLDCPALSDIIDEDLKMKTRTVEDKKAFVKYLNNQ